MYSRLFNEPPVHIVEKGQAHFGSFNNVSQRMDIKGMKAPYAGIPLPYIISNLRIKGRLNYFFNIEKYCGLVEFFDFKILGLAEVCFWNKESGKKYVYHSVMPPRRRFIPKNTDKGICCSFKKSRYIKVSWDKNHQNKSMRFHVKKNHAWPDAEGWIHSQREDKMHIDLSFVNPCPTASRCSATWLSTMKINGHLAIENQEPDNSSGFSTMIVNRCYSKTMSKSIKLCSMGNINQKDIIFYMQNDSTDSVDADKYNNNILIADGEVTALPSVVITHPFGINNKWIIQDTESMIDLTFTPSSLYSRKINLIFMQTNYSHIYGIFEGVLLTKNGEKINLKNFPGILTRNSLRS